MTDLDEMQHPQQSLWMTKEDADTRALRSFWRGFWVASTTYLVLSIVWPIIRWAAF